MGAARAIAGKGIGRGTLAAALAMLLAVGYCLGLFADAFRTERGTSVIEGLSTGMRMDYEQSLFDTSCVHRLDIGIDESAWQDLKDNALKKRRYDCDLAIDGEALHHVGVRAKGNSTLLQSVINGSDKMGLVFEFGTFQEGQTYHGLDVLSLYNNSCDSSCLRDMLALGLMREMGVPTPLATFAAVYLNGEYLGLYIALEGVGESFAQRNYGMEHGMIYKPEPSDVAGLLTGTAVGVDIDLRALLSGEGEGAGPATSFEDLIEVAALQYAGDDPQAYELIWVNSAFDIDGTDKERLIRALERLSDSDRASSTVALRQVAAYSAVNAFLLNTDCYATNMAHNYCLYEDDGILSMIPWDYDQCLGISMLRENADEDMTSLFNLPIDEPAIQVTAAERPMLECVLNSEESYALYRAELERLVSQYLESGWLDERVDAWETLIEDCVACDPLIGIDMQMHRESVQSIRDFIAIRTMSMRGQLDGTIPSTVAGQLAHPELLVDASAYRCPDGSLMNGLFLTDGEGIGLEDLLRVFNDQTSVYAVLRNFSFGWDDVRGILALLGERDDAAGSSPEATPVSDAPDEATSGPAALLAIRDEGEFVRQCIRLVWLTTRVVLLPLVAIIALVVALALLRRDDRMRGPRAKREGRLPRWARR